MDSVTGLYENKPSVAAVFPLLGPEAVEHSFPMRHTHRHCMG